MIRILAALVVLFAISCGGNGGTLTVMDNDGAMREMTVAEISERGREAIASDGWAAVCENFVAMTPESVVSGAAGMAAIGMVPDTNTALQLIAIMRATCANAQ